MNRFIDKEEYPDDMFIKPDDAPSKINASTVVIVVDVNRPQRTECPELLENARQLLYLIITEGRVTQLLVQFFHMLTHMHHQPVR